MFAPINYQPIDLQQRAFSRMLLQFRDSPVLLSLLWGFVSELQNLSDAIAGVINGRDPSKATGYNMDAIGRIVGQPRVILTASVLIGLCRIQTDRGQIKARLGY